MKEIGTLGEQLIGRWLQLQNYELLQQNWRCRWGEIDLIAQDRVKGAIAFVEVKTRSQNNWDEDGLLAIDSVKQHKILQTAALYLAEYPRLADLPCRFDVALVSYQIYYGVPNSIKLENLNQLKIGQPVLIQNYRFTLKNYLRSAFD
ncbi:MAG TPA: YraN family protein [Coleofasciculaceae cyanobacterium]|jgi:putative endonuclease